MHLTSPWVGHGLQGGSVPDGVMSVRAGSDNVGPTYPPLGHPLVSMSSSRWLLVAGLIG